MILKKILKEISQELHICTGVAGCTPEKDKQIRAVFSTIYRLIVDFAIKIYSLFEEANVGKVEAKMWQAAWRPRVRKVMDTIP